MREIDKNLSVTASEPGRVAGFARALPAERRQVFTLHKVYGYSGRDIATRLGNPVHAVEEHLIQAACLCAQAPDADGLGRRPSLLERLRWRIVHP
jgi:DNA-directed RNA polymerase specialized sigma24 family protein